MKKKIQILFLALNLSTLGFGQGYTFTAGKGSAPNRIFTAQWLNAQWDYNATGNSISFQARLYETSNKIEFVDRQEAGALNSASASIGIAGPSKYLFMSLDGYCDDGSLPGESDNVTIRASAAHMPTVTLDSANPAVCNNFTIQAGQRVTINEGKALIVNGILTISGMAPLKSGVVGMNEMNSGSGHPGMVLQEI